MKIPVSKLILFFTIFTTAGSVYGQSAGAPVIDDVRFVKGVFESNGVVQPYHPCPKDQPQGVCGNANSRGYSLNGRKDDIVTIRVTSKTGGAVFSIFNSNGELLLRGSAATQWTGQLPSDGDYRINVFTTKSYTAFKIRFARTQ